MPGGTWSRIAALILVALIFTVSCQAMGPNGGAPGAAPTAEAAR
ncbi:hypothetical protein ACQ5SO_10890 [Rhodovulum sp. DZ06]